MSSYYPADVLRTIRNQIPIEKVIVTMLNMEVRHTSKWLRFRCPRCYNFHTATNQNTNLARCFDCRENFNPIDIVMAVGECSFVEAVEYLKDAMG
jgi:ribosomal protein S27E